MRRFLALVIAWLILSGCSPRGLGPATSPEFIDLVHGGVPIVDGEILMVGTSRWYPNSKGFSDKYPDERSGIMVLTERSILMQQWDKEKGEYEILRRFELSDAAEVSLDRWALLNRIVIRWHEYSFDSFAYTSLRSQTLDNAKTEAAAELLKSLIKSQSN